MSKNNFINKISVAFFAAFATVSLTFFFPYTQLAHASEIVALDKNGDQHLVSESFEDVDFTAWYGEDVQWVVEHNIMKGYSNSNKFGIGYDLTRAELAVMLANYEKVDISTAVDTTGLKDLVSGGKWYTGACNWAYENKIITGYGSSGKFGPNDPVTREQAMVILARYAKSKGLDTDTSQYWLVQFSDKNDISLWALQSAAWGELNQIMSGYKQLGKRYLEPLDCVLREEIAKMFHKTIELVEIGCSSKHSTPSPVGMKSSSMLINNKTISYINCYKANKAPATGAGIWAGQDNTDDNSYGYFIGHNPGSFASVINLKPFDRIAVCDSEGKAKYYYVIDIFEVNRDTRWSQIVDKINCYKESVVLQTCNGSKYRIVVCAY